MQLFNLDQRKKLFGFRVEIVAGIFFLEIGFFLTVMIIQL